MRLWERIWIQGFVRLWERICETLDFGRGFVRICKTLGEDLQDFGRGFVRIHETLGEDSQGLCEDS